jgi:CDP-paratose 2-epimerase
MNRCGVIAGAGQFGKVNQDVVTLWVANHFFRKELRDTGFGGIGKQVRDLLHYNDLYDAIAIQMQNIAKISQSEIFNLGGRPRRLNFTT